MESLNLTILVVVLINTIVLLALAWRLMKPLDGQHETDWSSFEGDVPVTVGFVYDQEDTDGESGGALILDLFHYENKGIINPEDIITEYRGTAVSSGRDLDLLIDELEDVQEGELIEMKLRAQGTEESKIIQAVATKVAVKQTTTTLYADAKCNCGTKKHECVDARGSTCTITRVWKRKSAKKYEHRTKCQASTTSCPWTNWYSGK